MKDTIRRIVENARGDDLTRAKIGFRGLSPKQMDQPYGYSNTTPNQYLESCKKHYQKIDDCLAWLDNLDERGKV